MKRFIMLFATALLCKSVAFAVTTLPVTMPPSVTVSSVTAANGTATVTITTPTSVGPYSAGQYNYISHIRIEEYATVSLTPSATPITCTTTALQSMALKFSTALTTGTLMVTDLSFDNALQGTIASNVVISCPATSGVIWNMVINYFQGS